MGTANWTVVDLPVRSDDRGCLIALEGLWPVPFEIKRIFYIYGAGRDKRRGCHAHTNTQEFLVCLQGSCTVMLDDGKQRCTFSMDRPDKGLYVNRLIWIEVSDFSKDCIMMVLAERNYGETESIGDYCRFVQMKKKMETDRNAE